MTTIISSIFDLPNIPAVYALYGGQGQGSYVAYVGVADKLKNRIRQHLVRRDSSVTTGTSAAGLNPDYVTEVRWWEHSSFTNRYVLEAAERVAFDALEPALRSRGKITESVKQLYSDDHWRKGMYILFDSEPAGRLIIPSLLDALDRIAELERRIEAIENMLHSQ
jgi:hypothetical protein